MMPIHLRYQEDKRNGKMWIEVYLPGKGWAKYPTPIYPYVYSTETLKALIPKEVHKLKIKSQEVVKRKLLSSGIEKELYKTSFALVSEVPKLNEYLKRTGRESSVFESHIRFTDRILIDAKDDVNYLYDSNPTFLFIDIETVEKKILSLSYAVGDEEVISIWGEEDALSMLSCVDADVVVGYNVEYDIDILKERAKKHNIRLSLINCPQFDLLACVKADQTLYGLKNKKLKTVARFFNCTPIIELDTQDFSKYTQEEIVTYNKNDVELTRNLFNVYYPKYQALAELMEVPLILLNQNENSFPISVFIARELLKKNIISDGRNSQRFAQLSQFTGAYISLSRRGFFKNITKIDVKGMYPTAQIITNSSPETTWLERVERNASGDLSIEKVDNGYIYRVPDPKIGNLFIHVEDNEGVVVKKLKDLELLRERVKLNLKICEEKEVNKFFSQQCAIKVMRNVCYGYVASDNAYWGNKLCGILITAIGRSLIHSLEEYLKEKYGEVLIETDTDGIYLEGDINENEVREFVRDWGRKFTVVMKDIEIDIGKYKAGWFTKMKNYLLLTDNDTLIVHGAGLLGSHKTVLWDKALNDTTKRLLIGLYEDAKAISEQYLNEKNWIIKDLVMRRTLGKSVDKYEGRADLSVKLAEQYEEKHKKQPYPGTQFEFLKVCSGYQLYDASMTMEDIDVNYYKQSLVNLFENLELLRKGDKSERSDSPRNFSLENFTDGKTVCSRCKGQGILYMTIEAEKCTACKGDGVV